MAQPKMSIAEKNRLMNGGAPKVAATPPPATK